MKKKTKIVLLTLLVLYIISAIIIIFGYLIPHFQQKEEDVWYESEVQEEALNYVSDLTDDTTKRGVIQFFYSPLDEEIVESNRNRTYEEKVYPFTWVEVSVAAGKDIFILKMEVVSRGQFLVTDVRTEENDQYFTFW